MATLLGIDYGHKKIGFAVGQTITKTAKPLTVIKQNGEMWQQIGKLFEHWRPEKVIIGQPQLADGKPHPLEKLIENFIIELKTRYNAKIFRENEAYTSFEASLHRGAKKTKALDDYAAAILLESWMHSNPENTTD